MNRVVATLFIVLGACSATPEPVRSHVSIAVSARATTEPLPDVTVLSRGRGETTEFSPCAAAGRFVFCRRSGQWFGRSGAEDVVVRLDVEGTPPRVFDQNELTWDSPEQPPRLVSDGADAYWVTKTRIEKLPQGDEAPVVVHRFADREGLQTPDGVAIHAGEIWEQFIGRVGGVETTTILGTDLGGERFNRLVELGLSPRRRNFFVGAGVRAWVLADEPALAVMRDLSTQGEGRADSVTGTLPVNLGQEERGEYDAPNVLVAFSGSDLYFVAPFGEGYAVSIAGRDRQARTLYSAEDVAEELPTHETITNIVLDETYLYYLDPDWQNEENHGVRLLRLRRDPQAPAKPTTLGVVQEGGTMWLYKGKVHMIGAITGDIVRFNGSASPETSR